MLNDKWLIFKFRHGSQHAFGQIFEKYREDLLRLALSLLQERSSAEDIVHEVFLHLIQVRLTFRLTGSLRAYLATCVANRVRNFNRNQRQMKPIYSECVQQKISEILSPDQWAQCSEEFDNLRDALLQLPKAQQEVTVLHVYGKLTFKQIALHQACSVKTVESRYRYALHKLGILLEKQVDV